MSVSKKMLSLLLSAALGIVILAALGLTQMSRVYEITNYANVNVVPSIQTLDKAFSPMAASRTQLWQHIAASDPAVMSTLEERISANRKKVDEALKAYEPLISDDKDKSLLAADRAALADYDQLRERVYVLSRVNKMEEARDLVMANQAIMARLWDAFEEHREYNAELGRKAADEAAQTLGIARWQAITISLVTLVAVCLIGFFITRSLMRQLGGEPAYAAEVVAKIAEGDLSTEVLAKAGDTSSLLYSVKCMSERLAAIIAEVRTTADSLASSSEEV
ncbi:MAG TPA: MCP four helix bundle domain-containing protein, partial [Rhodocyclaceae bacterium]|nr:MCP four helix bundle domain-containing protein [Rhodocyclaceae bacterium]HMY50161.1 MCP four helix bundle domain-containing protein [Rhodocyclaceae bacterium]HMZ76740.1 MCP four helix bundle domain-containing protein [Rhodocyclaceae bacterium]HNB65387.1 MCP four helix bundle domain-containing protein [Rhodocyclaceae bacterium]HNC79909.1 MCP four helix bundle domain-containing protein [Rhodocyclaceae bacterium]